MKTEYKVIDVLYTKKSIPNNINEWLEAKKNESWA
jgi:hypothetical protein